MNASTILLVAVGAALVTLLAVFFARYASGKSQQRRSRKERELLALDQLAAALGSVPAELRDSVGQLQKQHLKFFEALKSLADEQEERMKQTREALLESVTHWTEATLGAAEHSKQIPKLQEGLIKVCEAQVEQLQALLAAVEKNTLCVRRLHGALFSSGGRDGFTEPDEDAADAEQATIDLMRDHKIGREEAAARVKNERQWRGSVIT